MIKEATSGSISTHLSNQHQQYKPTHYIANPSFHYTSVNMSEWKDKVAIITGGSSGIGAGIVVEFAKLGCAVAIVGRNEKNLEGTADKCKSCGLPNEKILCITADMVNDDDVKLIVTKTINKFGKINVLVNNAGISKVGGLPAVNMKEYDEVMRVNVRSVVLLSQEATPHLIKTKGNIVNISSVMSNQAWPGILAYAMSKAAVDHFTRCSAVDLAPKGVRINSVQPGMIETQIYDRLGMSKEQKDQLMDKNRRAHPMGRLGTTQDIGRACVFLASENSSFTTGQTLAIDGGFSGTME
uniref:Ketoreductase (KR) domain-containing protein n=1 Tax=Strigamia maritima TaxID=126957 RepID=T1JDD7_STRMM